MLKVALATFTKLAQLNDDDAVLLRALRKRGVSTEVVIWSESLDWSSYQIVVIRSCWDYIDNPVAFKRWLETLSDLGICVINHLDTILWNLEKTYLQKLEKNGVKIVPTVWIDSKMSVDLIEKQMASYKTQNFVIKPVVGNDANGLSVLSRQNLRDGIAYSMDSRPSAQYMLQPFLSNVIDEGEWSLVFIGGKYSHCILKNPAPGDFRSQHTRGGTFKLMNPAEAALDQAKRAIAACPKAVFARVDLIREEDQFLVGEVEMIEPYLYFDLFPESAENLVDSILEEYSSRAIDLTSPHRADDFTEKCKIGAILDHWYEELQIRKHFQIGYPIAQDLDHADMGRFLDIHINNVGDPFGSSNLVNSFDAEREILCFFAELFHAPKDDFWGYVTSGGTEGNLYGLWAARTRLPAAAVYYSEDSLYSVTKILNILQMKGVPVPAHLDGTINLAELRRLVRERGDRSAIWHANIGTTMKGAVDDVVGGIKIFEENGVDDVHVHCDAALFGPMLPFFEGFPQFDFRAGTASISFSGHKFLGSPVPVGVVLTRKSLCNPGVKIEYIDAIDATISGSRDGFSTLVLWKTLQQLGKKGLASRAAKCLELTFETLGLMQDAGIHAWAHPYSNTVVFPRPSRAVIKKWHLATSGEISHIILMPGIKIETVEHFVRDVAECIKVSSSLEPTFFSRLHVASSPIGPA